MKKAKFADLARFVLSLKQNKAKETILAATRQITRLISHFGKFSIDEITPGRWAEYVVKEQKRRHRTFYDDKKYMRMILIHALNEGLTQKRVELQIPDTPSEVGTLSFFPRVPNNIFSPGPTHSERPTTNQP